MSADLLQDDRLGEAGAGAADWDHFFRAEDGYLPHEVSTFGRWVHERAPINSTIVDLAAGHGRDTAFFAAAGRRVISLDHSRDAVRLTRRSLTRLGVQADTRVLRLGDLGATLRLGGQLARSPEPPTLYARQLLGCLEVEQRAQLWRLASRALRRGGSFHLEYSARPGCADTVGSAEHLVRRCVPTLVWAEIVASGGRVVRDDTAAGDDFLDHLDTAVVRLEARWDAPS